MGRLRGLLVGFALYLATAASLAADVVRVVVERRSVAWSGLGFGETGSYELIQLRLFFEFDPNDPDDRAVVDLALAPRNADGLVEAQATVWVLQPVEAQRRRGLAWIDIDPEGVGPASPLIAAARRGAGVPADGPGDGLLLEEGLTLIQIEMEESGVPRVEAPGGGPVVARDSAGAEIIGWVRRRWEPSAPVDRLDLDVGEGWHHPVAMPEAPVHRLYVGAAGEAATDSVPAAEWRLAGGPGAGDAQAVVLEGGFEPNRSYELVYRARDPRVQGLSLAVLRDVMSHARYGVRSEFPVDRGIAFGSGVGGRMLRQFVHDGFNDAGGRIAFDAVWMHGAGAGRGDVNRRFALPGQDRDFVDLFPFTLEPQFDPVTGLEEGLLPEGESIPRTILTHTAADYRERAAALTHTAVDGLSDRPPPEGHRAYHLAGAARAADATTGADPNPGDLIDPRPTLRALALAAVRWVTDDVAMPPSALPSVGSGTLVGPTALALPELPGDGGLPREAHMVYRDDPGPRFRTLGIADRLVPERGPAFPVLLPQVDGFGNELGGVRPLELRVPVATYASGRLLSGFAPTPDDAGDDSRPDLQSLYGSEAGFLARVRAAAEALVAEGFLLERDRSSALEAARERWQRTASPPGR